MQIDDQIFFGEDINTVYRDCANWKKQFSESYEYFQDGYRFVFIRNQKTNRVLHYVERVFYSIDEKMYILELHFVEIYESIRDAQIRCKSIIEAYIDRIAHDNACR